MESVVGELAAELKGSSDLRPGEAAELVGLKLEAAPPAALARKADSTHFILYLSKETWIGEAGDALAEEVRKARAAGLPITMVHSTADNADGCEFGELFATTPPDLIQDGLYTALALALYPPPFRHVSACLVARALGAKKLSAKGMAGAVTADATLLQRAATGKLQRMQSRKVELATRPPVAVAAPVTAPALQAAEGPRSDTV